LKDTIELCTGVYRDIHIYAAMKSELLDKVEEFATAQLKSRLSPTLYFHNLRHTREVVEATLEIGKHSDLTEIELETVTIAAWFHDVGYCKIYKGHEVESANNAFVFLSIMGMDKLRIEQIISCILATRMPQKPTSILEKVICDADFYHFSRHDYQQHEQALKKEWEIALGLNYTKVQWTKLNYTMLKEHTYWTPYGKTVLQIKKEANIKQLTT